ncbi:MAG: AAA family ATPase [Gemmatimonadaceae bacterium]
MSVPWGRELPLVGRRAELTALRIALDDAMDGRGHTMIVTGDSGVGKTRLISALMKDAAARDMLVANGQAFPIEAGFPFGVIADALVPALRSLDPAVLSLLTRGADADLHTLLPGLQPDRGTRPSGSADPDARTRLFWNFAQFLQKLGDRRGVLLIVENVQWADASSLELLHFLGRQIRGSRVMIALTYNSAEIGLSPTLRTIERSLVSLGVATLRTLQPLTRGDLVDLLHYVFKSDPTLVAPLADRVCDRTLGNPFFVQETLKALLSHGHLREENGRWIGWEADVVGLPATIRAAVSARLEELSPSARRVAEVAAVIGTAAPLDVVARVADLGAEEFARAFEELTVRQIVVEAPGDEPGCVFAHPIVQSTVFEGLSAARARLLHGRVADALEQHLGDRALQAAPEIARHLVLAQASEGEARALRYFAAAGRDAFQKRADREAVHFLSKALDLADKLSGTKDDRELLPMLEELARACERIGERDRANIIWARARARAEAAEDDVAVSRIARRQGQASATAGWPHEALRQLVSSEQAARRAGRIDLAIRVRVAMAVVHQSWGRSDDGKRVMEEILPDAEALGDRALLARVHRALLLLYGWTGPADIARAHGKAVLAHAEASGDDAVAWSAHWAMAFYAGITGNGVDIAIHQGEAERLARKLRSPVMQVSTAEIGVEYASGVGDWGEGLAVAERITPMARAIAPTTVLPRLLVWTGIILLARDETARAKALFDESWQISGAQAWGGPSGEGQPQRDVHNVILSHTGMAAYYLQVNEYERALDFGKRGLEIADRYSYVVWAIHRLLPIIAETAIWLQDYDLAEAIRDRLREQSTMLGHRLGLAWATGIDALVSHLKYRAPDAAARLLHAADELDAVPFVYHAARLRKFAVSLLEADDDREGAIRELRKAHDVFVRLGAEFELLRTRSHLRSLGVRLPPRHVTEGVGVLTGRELDIVRLVVRRKSNKEIATALDISVRTVSTHLSNIFNKLSIESRGDLADLARDNPALAGSD